MQAEARVEDLGKFYRIHVTNVDCGDIKLWIVVRRRPWRRMRRGRTQTQTQC